MKTFKAINRYKNKPVHQYRKKLAYQLLHSDLNAALQSKNTEFY